MSTEELDDRLSDFFASKCCGKLKKTLTANGSQKIPAGKAVDMIKVKSESILAALEIGTTEGGSEVLTSIATTTGWDSFLVSAFDTSPYTLYFTGITSSTQIIIYLR